MILWMIPERRIISQFLIGWLIDFGHEHHGITESSKNRRFFWDQISWMWGGWTTRTTRNLRIHRQQKQVQQIHRVWSQANIWQIPVLISFWTWKLHGIWEGSFFSWKMGDGSHIKTRLHFLRLAETRGKPWSLDQWSLLVLDWAPHPVSPWERSLWWLNPKKPDLWWQKPLSRNIQAIKDEIDDENTLKHKNHLFPGGFYIFLGFYFHHFQSNTWEWEAPFRPLGFARRTPTTL